MYNHTFGLCNKAKIQAKYSASIWGMDTDIFKTLKWF